MTRVRWLVVVLALGLALGAGVAQAGDYHRDGKLICQECHVMHGQQAHDYLGDLGNSIDGGVTDNYATIGASAPYEYLLRDEVNNLCLSCHDGVAEIPDVLGGNGDIYVRQGGALNGLGTGVAETGHTLGTMDAAPGGDGSYVPGAHGLNCANCHAVHGSNSLGVNSYRNLGGHGTAIGQIAISYSRLDADGGNDLLTWVFEDVSDSTQGGDLAGHYGAGSITFNEPDQTASAYAAICKACHTDFHGTNTDPNIAGTGDGTEAFVRHPTAGVNIGALGGGHSRLTAPIGNPAANQVHVMSPAGKRAGTYDGTLDLDLTPSCFSCHKAHGNNNPFGLIYMRGTGAITEDGDDGDAPRDLCKQCHGQGGAIPGL